MHTVLVIAAGLGLLGIMLLIASARGRDRVAALSSASRYFIAIWFVASAANMAAGVLRAGYSVADEAPISFLVFGVPAVSEAPAGIRFRH